MHKKTKIIATIGPASSDRETLISMIREGMNVCRLNFSHGDHSWHKGMIDLIRDLSRELKTPIGILGDLQGPRIRTHLENDLEIITGDKILVCDISCDVSIRNNAEQSQKLLVLDHPGVISMIEIGNEILIEDGLMSLRITEKDGCFLKAEVIDGGLIKNHKGVNIPDAKLTINTITEKDEKDLRFLVENHVDFIALSFVGSAADIESLRDKISLYTSTNQSAPLIVSKIERKAAMENLDEIISATDCVMVARGDLAIEVPQARVVVYQKRIIEKSIRHLKPVIVATQMLNSMIVNPRPTRAEISDVSNAVIDHTDAVMLSGESASGKYPIESVRAMREIIEVTEESPYDDVQEAIDLELKSEYAALARSAFELMLHFPVKAVVMISLSGFTARLLSHFRPNSPILVVTNNETTYNQMTLFWGIHPYILSADVPLDDLIERLIHLAKEEGELITGDNILVIAGRLLQGEGMRLIGLKKIQ